MLTIKTLVRKTKTTHGVAIVEFADQAIGTVETNPGKGSLFSASSVEGVDLGDFNTRAAAQHAVWRASTGKGKSTRGGDQRSDTQYKTRKGTAEFLGVSLSTVARKIKSGALTETNSGIRV